MRTKDRLATARSWRRGDLRRSYTPEQLKKIPVKAPAERRLIGRDTMALDVPSKTTVRVATALMPKWKA